MTEWAPPEEFDDYVIERPLGHGTMGRVFLAHDAVLARPVAVKFLAALEPDAASRQRFLLEARATARLQHPNVVAIYRVGELDDKPYIVTEFVRGEPLDKVAMPIAAEDVLALGMDLARGLAAAHRRGVIHGDIKPANVMVAEDGVAKLLDFGLATLVDAGPAGMRTIAGTPDYMAPELWLGQPADRRSDVYALGAVLYQLLTAHPPFHDVAPRDLARIVQDRDAPRVGTRSTDPRLAEVIDRCLARAAEARYASGDELREALEQCRDRAATPVPGGNPYRGLRPFEADHRQLFFGRASELGVVIDRLRAESFVLISGDSGSGKSSLCRAAVLPTIADGALGHGRTWTTVQLVPGRRPFHALAAALATALDVAEDVTTEVIRGDNAAVRAFFRERLGTKLGLVVFCDQLEELLTIAEPDQRVAADRALARLGAGVGGVRLLATARADFLGRLAALSDLGESLTRALMFLRPLGKDEIRQVIVGPADATGVRFETEAMVDDLVAATAGAHGGLPLLQFALAELWAARDTATETITAGAMASLGGVDGALARHADSVIATLTPAQAAAARRMLTRLVTADATRARRTEADLVAGEPAARAALDALVRGRLLVAHEADDGSAYELSHEVLVRGWGTLRGWLVEDADQRLLADRVHVAASEWERLERGRDALWSARQLAEAGRVREGELAPLDQAFLAASRRRVTRRRWLTRGGIVAVPALVVAIYFGVQIANQRALDRKVDGLRAVAARTLAAADAKVRLADDHRGRAFPMFDAPDLAAPNPTEWAETEWSLAVAAAAEANRELAHASREFEVALSADPTRDDIRRQLGLALLARAARADRDGRHRDRDELIERLPLYDPDGGLMSRWHAAAPLRVQVTPANATITIRGDGDPQRLPVPAAVVAGTYVIEAIAPEHAAMRHVFVARRGEPSEVELQLVPAGAVPEGYVAIPPGEFQFGTFADEETRTGFFYAAPQHPRRTAGYLIGRYEVTFGDWIAYLEALPEPERTRRLPRAEADVSAAGGLKLEPVPGGWQLRIQPFAVAIRARTGERFLYRSRTTRANQDWLRFPVTGVDSADAVAYTAWLDASGRVPGARLCTEVEWERAARGADGRIFPHGSRLALDDVNIDQTYGKNPAQIGPDEVGAHPASISPYGLHDTSGNAFEWTTSAMANGYVLRGGAFFYDSKTAQLVNRAVVGEGEGLRNSNLGLRVCARWPG